MARSKTRESPREPALNIVDLPILSIVELRDQWRLIDRSNAPVHISREVLIQAIAYRLQEREHGGLSPTAKRQLGSKVAVGSKGRQSTAVAAPRVRMRQTVKAGTRFLREWQGRTYEVLALADGSYSYASVSYRSLSEVARAITGTRWSGPAFFGLKESKRKENG